MAPLLALQCGDSVSLTDCNHWTVAIGNLIIAMDLLILGTYHDARETMSLQC